MRLLIATDAWFPQVNGVVRTLDRLQAEVTALGHEVHMLSPDGYKSLPLPTYNEIRLALTTPGHIAKRIESYDPDYIHIATEGPIGLMTRRWCVKNDRPFTTSYHTRFPEYVRARMPVPITASYRYLTWFHNAGRAVMVTTESLTQELEGWGFRSIARWPRGVDHELFRPQDETVLDFEGPIFLYVGRVAVEKNIEAFLALDLPGTKVVVGDGPQRAQLEAQYTDARFLGAKFGEELAAIYASADVFVFPSKTDTLGLVILEALACGVPVAAYPVTGPKDLIGDAPVGVLGDDLQAAALNALDLSRTACREHALRFTWTASAQSFLDNVVTFQESYGEAA
ncbi:MAG: glycosyltransferase family 1 protein [Pseudomonadota bacterium]